MQLKFEAPSLERLYEYNTILAACPQLPTSDYAFANIYGWAEHYGLEWTIENGLAWIRQTKPETLYWAPLGAWNNYDWKECSIIPALGRFTRVPECLAKLWSEHFGDSMEIKENRDHWDYVYSVPELIELRGNRFHKKKNLLKQFVKKYSFEYSPLGPECVEEVLEMQEEWLRWFEEHNPSDALQAENVAITRVLQQFDQIDGLMGGAIRVDGKVVAYTVAEPVSPDSVVIHFEKANTYYKGVYQAINQMFLEAQCSKYTYVNREQDLGEEGLRKAKLSYNPSLFLKKFEAVVR
ncbi:MAG: phosphatidylglycerol lysyltransferase domain-containing protein [Desulfovibrionaceae bacterium]